MAYKNKIIRNLKTGQDIHFINTSNDTSGQFLEMEATYIMRSPKQPPLHYHPHQEEDFTILEGELTVQLENKTWILKKGDTLHIPKNTAHTMWNAGNNKAVMHWMVRPAMNTEYLLETIAGLAADNKTNSDGRPALLQAAVTANYFSKVFRLTKPSRTVQNIVFGLLGSIGYIAGYRPVYKKYFN